MRPPRTTKPRRSKTPRLTPPADLDAPPGARGGSSTHVRRELRYAAELIGLSALAVAQPLFDVFGKAPDAFLFRQADAADIYLFALVITFGPPLVLYALTAPFALVGPTARRRAHLAAAGLLVVAFLVLLTREVLRWGTVGVALCAAVGAVGFVAAYQRFPMARTWVGYLALAAPTFALLFLLSSPTSALLDDGDRAPAAAEEGSGPHVVMIVLDELPLASLLDEDGAIDAGLYPNLAALADDSMWYRNATSVAGATWHAMPSMLTGRYPVKYEMPIDTDHRDNLFTELAPHYDIDADEILTRLCPVSVCDSERVPGVSTGIGALLSDSGSIYRDLLVPPAAGDAVTSFREATVPVSGEEHAASDPAQPGFGDFESSQPARYRAFLERLGRVGPSSPPTFSYLHLLLPHEPWRFYPSGAEYEAPAEDIGRNIFDWSEAEAPVAVARQRHALQLAYADQLVGGVVDQLRATGTYDESVVVLTSDHGVAFTPGEPVRGTAVDADIDEVAPELMWVPLFVKAPGLPAGEVSDENVMTVDIVPTVADLTGVELSYEADGISLLSETPRAAPEKVFFPVEISQFGNVLGERRTVDGAIGLEATLDNPIAELMPDRRDSALRPYRLGPFGSLVGEPLDELSVGQPVEERLVLTIGQSIDDPDDAERVPGLLAGRLESGAVGLHLAVVVNGRVAATVETFDTRGEPGQFTGLVPQQLVRGEANEVSFFLIAETAGEVELRPVSRAD